MKILYLVRHAKSSWKFPDLADFDRPLNKRGRRDAPMMGQRLRQRGILPDLMISSPAERAKRTAQAVAEAIEYPTTAVQYDEALYHASASAMLTVLQAVADTKDVLMLVGHNPGLTELANYLSPHPIDNVVTTGIVAVVFPVTQWSEITLDKPGKLRWYDYPKAR